MQSATESRGTHWKYPPTSSASAMSARASHAPRSDDANNAANTSNDELLSNLCFLQRMADAFEQQGNYAECVRSAESALLLRQANAAAVAAILSARQQQQQQRWKKQNVSAAARKGASSSHAAPVAAAPLSAGRPPEGLVALTDQEDVWLPLEMSQQAQDVVQRCNSYAVEALRHGQFDSAAFFLNRAMFLTDADDDDVRDVTLNSGGAAPGRNEHPSDHQWWWRQVLQQQQQQQSSAVGAREDEPALSFPGEHASATTSHTALGDAASSSAAAAAAFRACFRNTPQDQHLRRSLRAATLNHLGCLEQRRGRLSAAVIFFRMAIRMATELEGSGNSGGGGGALAGGKGLARSASITGEARMSIASTYLNLCTVLNGMGRHAEAVQACERVVPLLQQTLQETISAPPPPPPFSQGAAALSDDHANAETGVVHLESEETRAATMLVVAYYNLGVSLERRDDISNSSSGSGAVQSANGRQDGPRRAFANAVQVSHAYGLVPESCRSIDAVMKALRHPQNPSTTTRTNPEAQPRASENAQPAPSSSLSARGTEEEAELRQKREAVQRLLAAETTSAPPPPPISALPRIAPLTADTPNLPLPPPQPSKVSSSSVAAPAVATHRPSPPPHPRSAAAAASPSGSNSNTVAPHYGSGGVAATAPSTSTATVPRMPPTQSPRPPSSNLRVSSARKASSSAGPYATYNNASNNNSTHTNNNNNSSAYAASASTHTNSAAAPSNFTASKAWSSPFSAAAPPAVLTPLPAGLLATTPPPPPPPAALFARSGAATAAGSGHQSGGEMNFAATAPPGFARPLPQQKSYAASQAVSGSNGGGVRSSVVAGRAASNPFGRRTFGSTLPLPSAGAGGAVSTSSADNVRASSARGTPLLELSARSQNNALTTTTTTAMMNGGATRASTARLNMTPSAGTTRGTSRGPRDRLTAATSTSKGQQQQPQSQRAKRQKSIDRRQQREAAAADAVLAEKMYQQLVSEKEKTEVEQCRRAAVQIQRVWRGVLARTWVSTLIAAATRLQRAVRTFLVKARAEHARVAAAEAQRRAEESARQEAACRVLQARVRQFLRRLQIRREYRANQARLYYAARTIQRGYRAFCAQRAAQLAAQAEQHRREDEQRRFREKVAARRIQHAYLHYKTKRAELDAYQVRQRRIKSVIRIQAVVRGYLTRAWYAYYRVYRREQEVRSAAMQAKLVVIQSACRAIYSAYYGQQRALQALLRMREAQRHSAATRIQCMWRCHVAVIHRERLQAEHDRDVRHATRIQRWYRMRTERRAFTEWRAQQQRLRAAGRLQRWMRACWQAAKAREFAAYHADLLRKQQLQRLQARAITVMQACANACVSGRLVASVRDTFERNDAMARRWQRVGRGYAARREMALERRAAYHVAMKEKETARRTAAALVLQRAWRCAAAKDKVESMRREIAAANIVARAYRVYRARVQLASLRAARQQQIEEAAARRIQQVVRGFLYEQRAKEMDAYYRAEHNKKMRRLRRAEAAVMIQSQWRGYVTRKVVQEERDVWRRHSAAAAVIQRAWRSRQSRRQLHQTLAVRITERNQDSKAALTVQCFWRKVMAARRVAQLRRTTRQRAAAAAALQSWWRVQLAKREFARRQRQRREEAALEVYYAIQWEKHATLVNAFLRQRESQEAALRQLRRQLINLLTDEGRRRFLSRHEAATKIQALFRGHYERYYVRGLRAQRREEQRRAEELVARQQRAATKIQCAYRSAVARRALAELRQAEFDRVQASHADYLESADPGEVVRELFWLNSTYQQREKALRRKQEAARRNDAAARIQRLFRRRRAHRVVAAALDTHKQERAARLLQDYWRHHRDVRRINENVRRQQAATMLQSHIRGWLVRRSWPLYRAAIEAERQERVLVQDVLDHAAIVLQCFWRRIEAQRTAERLRHVRQAEHDARAQQEAAAVIQDAFRRYRLRKRMNAL